jgi:hypothetical protein
MVNMISFADIYPFVINIFFTFFKVERIITYLDCFFKLFYKIYIEFIESLISIIYNLCGTLEKKIVVFSYSWIKYYDRSK